MGLVDTDNPMALTEAAAEATAEHVPKEAVTRNEQGEITIQPFSWMAASVLTRILDESEYADNGELTPRQGFSDE